MVEVDSFNFFPMYGLRSIRLKLNFCMTPWVAACFSIRPTMQSSCSVACNCDGLAASQEDRDTVLQQSQGGAKLGERH